MNQSERRQFLLRELLAEEPEYRSLAVPADGGQVLHGVCVQECCDLFHFIFLRNSLLFGLELVFRSR